MESGEPVVGPAATESLALDAPSGGSGSNPARKGRRTRLLIGASAGWLGFVVAQRSLSGRWWLWMLPDLIPPPAFLLVPLLLLALTPLAPSAKKWPVLLAFAGLVYGVGLTGINPHALRPTSGSAPPGALRIVSWNTEVWHQSDDPDHFYHFIAAQDADIYLLQEYMPYGTLQSPRVDLVRLLLALPGYRVVTTGELLTISRFPITAVRTLPASPPGVSWRTEPSTRENWDNEYQSIKVLRTDIAVGAHTMSVYNAHITLPFPGGSPFSSTLYMQRRLYFNRRAAQFQSLQADIATNRRPILVAGDFNTSPVANDLRGLSSRLRELTQFSRSIYPASWPAVPLPAWRLDRAFASSALRIHDYRLRDSDGLSDHRLQSIRVSFRSKG